ncbi:MAG: hypothetical protein IPM98_18530 [Lewinellaceae bacterium]|nr:hypothetical protein [Lewinellaceae bacterium]
MTKNILSGLTALLLTLLAFACKNNTPADAKASGMTYPFEKPDSIFGLEGCAMAGFRAFSDTTREFYYQNFRIKVTDKSGEPGQIIQVVLDSTNQTLDVPASTEAGFFSGAARDHFFVDIGTTPDARQMLIYNIRDGALLQTYRAEYLAAEPPFISTNGAFWFYAPIEESDMLKMPDCPDKEKWVKDGLRIGYGQRYIYNLVNRMLTRKSEYICAPFQ